MNKLQYDSFYKFIVSIGVILITAPIIGIYYLVSGSFNMILSKQELIELSDISLQFLQSKEKWLNLTYSVLPYAFICFIIIGLFCIIWGGVKWYGIQKKLDESIELDVVEKRTKIKAMTPSEITEKVLKEESERNAEMELSQDSKNHLVKITRALQIENASFQYIKSKLYKQYNIKQNVRINGYEYDLIAISHKKNIDLLYEIKYWANVNISAESIRYNFEKFNAAGINYETNMHRNFQLVLFIISNKEGIPRIKEQVNKCFEKLDKAFISKRFKVEYIDENTLFSQ